MPLYSYKVRDTSSRLAKGTLEADSLPSAARILRARNCRVISLQPQQVNPRGLRFGFFYSKVKSKDLAVFCQQLFAMLNAGMPMFSSLGILKEQSHSFRLKEALARVQASLEAGETLSMSLGEFPMIFPRMMVGMVGAGETGGALEEVLKRLGMHFQREHDIGEKVKSAMLYPAIVLCIALASVVFMLTFVLPVFINMLQSLDTPLPLSTRAIIGLSNGLGKSWFLIPILALGLRFGGKGIFQTTRGMMWRDTILLKLPVFGSMINKLAISRLTRTLGTMLKGGVPVLQALEVAKDTAGNLIVARVVEEAQAAIREGRGMSKRLQVSGLFPPMVVQMIAVGEETGALDSLLEKISDFLDQEVDQMVSRLATVLEPAIIVGLGGIVGLIVISIWLPMFSVLGTVQ